jgi:hypothetical protein
MNVTTEQQPPPRQEQFRDASDCALDCFYCTGPETD